MASTVASRKQRGRLLQQFVATKLLEVSPILQPDDIVSRSMGSPGCDILLSPYAKSVIGNWDIECKNQETISIWSAIQQCEARGEGKKPMVVFKRNRTPAYVCMKFDDWIDIIKGNLL